MPSGVEHLWLRKGVVFTDEVPITVAMPSGVEHDVAAQAQKTVVAADHRRDALGR